MIKIDQTFFTGGASAAESKVAFPGCDIPCEVLTRSSELGNQSRSGLLVA
jgi:hypothetical protein